MGTTSARLFHVETTVATRAQARRLVDVVLSRRLAVCANEIAISATYPWKGRRVRQREVLVIFKTTRSRASALRRCIATSHPYELPYLATLGPFETSPEYAAWATAETGPVTRTRSGSRGRRAR